MKIPFKTIFKKKEKARPSSAFSRFFYEASSQEQKKVIIEAAKSANETQRAIFYNTSSKSDNGVDKNSNVCHSCL